MMRQVKSYRCCLVGKKIYQSVSSQIGDVRTTFLNIFYTNILCNIQAGA